MIVEQRQDETVPWLITLARGDDVALTYTGAETLTAQIWAGDDQEVLLTPTVAWVDAPSQIQVTIDATTLGEGDYQLRVRDNADADIAWHQLRVLPAPGTGEAPTTYCSFDDLLVYAPWLKNLAGESDQTGFIEQRHLARVWLDQVIQRHCRPGRNWISLGPGTVWLGGSSAAGASTWLQDLLDDDGLLISASLREAAAKYAISQVLAAQVSGQEGTKTYQGLAVQFRGEAHAALSVATAEIDTDGDGAADIVIDLGRVLTLDG